MVRAHPPSTGSALRGRVTWWSSLAGWGLCSCLGPCSLSSIFCLRSAGGDRGAPTTQWTLADTFISDSFVSKVQAQNQNGSLIWDGQAEMDLDRGSAVWH